MTKEQIQKYEYCKKHLEWITSCKKGLTFGIQKYGCGTGVPNIEHTLDKVNRDMYEKTIEAMEEATEKVQKIVNAL